ncbi:hypothetical protein Scep_010914 [Stephania cephalantha]|uniref:Aminotransferase-like plant mobile domain-containing protein n=1 Tax=Stephania cephalantha TaxID=152367 RepID=A0AAP0PDR9_9MAGN
MHIQEGTQNPNAAIVDRWWPKTNTFHLPFGEMSITLEDVSMLLKIPVMGKVVNYPSISRDESIELIVRALQVSEKKADKHLNKYQKVLKSWLKSRWGDLPKLSNKYKEKRQVFPVVECTTRAYMWYLLGCTLFVDKTSTLVPVELLALVENLEEVHTYTYGAAALAYLYRQLGSATRVNVCQIHGYLTLLEGWVYDHFNVVLHEARRAQLMLGTLSVDRESRALNINRRALDSTRSNKVTWDPYSSLRTDDDFAELAFYTGTINFFGIVEPHHPDRFLKQLGHVQRIPSSP